MYNAVGGEAMVFDGGNLYSQTHGVTNMCTQQKNATGPAYEVSGNETISTTISIPSSEVIGAGQFRFEHGHKIISAQRNKTFLQVFEKKGTYKRKISWYRGDKSQHKSLKYEGC